MKKLFVSDCDGTLLNSDAELEKQTIDAIKRFQDLGGIFMIATGRDLSRLNVITSKIDNLVISSSNGALLTDCDKTNLIHHYVDKEDVISFSKVVEKYNCCAEYRCIDANYSTNDEEYFIDKARNSFSKRFSKKSIEDRYELIYGYKLSFSYDINQLNKLDVLKMELLFLDDNDNKEEIYNELAKQLKSCEIIYGMHANHFEINSKKANKAQAIREYCKIKNIDEDDVIVVGDSYNDVEMLKMFNNSYCVANGANEAKEVSKGIIDSNNDFGVAKLLNSICES